MTEKEIKQKIVQQFGIDSLVTSEIGAGNLESEPQKYTGLTGSYLVYLEKVPE